MKLSPNGGLIRNALSLLSGGREAFKTVEVRTGELIPFAGEIIDGTAIVDESAIVGVSSPAMLSSEPGRNQTVAGTLIVDGYLKIKYDPAAQRS